MIKVCDGLDSLYLLFENFSRKVPQERVCLVTRSDKEVLPKGHINNAVKNRTELKIALNNIFIHHNSKEATA